MGLAPCVVWQTQQMSNGLHCHVAIRMSGPSPLATIRLIARHKGLRLGLLISAGHVEHLDTFLNMTGAIRISACAPPGTIDG